MSRRDVITLIQICVAFFPLVGRTVPLETSTDFAAMRVTRVVSLTSDTNYYMRPCWSPDGQWIAFTRGKSIGIELIRIDGSGRRALTQEIGAGYKLAWSPDSREIAYRTLDFVNGLQTIKVVDVETGKIDPLCEPAPNLQPPVWRTTETSKKVCYMADGAMVETAARPIIKSSSTRLSQNNQILYFDRGNILAYEGKEKKPRQLSQGGGLDPLWSPDGRKIIYLQTDKLMIVDANGENRKELCLGIHPSWSPDSRKIVFQITRDHSHAPSDGRQHGPDTLQHRHDDKTNHQIVDSDLYIINTDGTGRIALTKTVDKIEVDPAWSPDGKHIVYRTEDTGQLYLLELE